MIPKKEVILRRTKLANKIKNNSTAIFFSKDQIIKGDGEYFDTIDSNIYYFTNIQQANTILLIKKTRGNVEEHLFIEENSKFHETWTGKKLNKQEAKKISGIKNIHYLEDFNSFKTTKTIYLHQERVRGQYFKQENYQKSLKDKTILNSLPITQSLREIKSKEEIKEIKKAIKITEIAIKDILKKKHSLKEENEIEALLSYHYTKNKATHAFHPIVASNKNATILHYINNKDKIKNLILIDTGAELNKYSADISRTFPKRKFTKRQAEVYQSVLNIQKQAIKLLKPGILWKEYQKEVYKISCQELIKLKLISEEQLKKDTKAGLPFILHGIGHFLGLDSHDIGNYEEPLKPNQVLTVEPGIYIKEESIGIRIEDNILLTKKGNINLSKNIPKEIKDLEK